ncbi:hypothetical protein L6R50_19710, partial [Myxococcota bacterium]|nr:hypothetical protein [Myxococcota bacterium]
MIRLLEAQARAWREFTPESFRLWTQEGAAGPFVGTVAVAVPPSQPSKPVHGKDPSTPLGKQPQGVPWSKDPPPDDGGLTLDDPWDEPRTGVSHWEFSVMANGLAGVDILNERRREHGTAAELLRDAERLGIGWLRQLGDADAHLDTMWKGCWAYADLDSADNYWRLWSDDDEADVIEPGWRCPPGTAPTPAVWSPPAALPGCSDPPPDVCPTTGGPTFCAVPAQSPAVMSDALMDVAVAAEDRGIAGVLPVLIGHGDRGEREEDPCVSLRYYDWEYVNEGGFRQTGPAVALFELHPVDDLLALTGGVNEDVLLAEFMRQLIGNRPGRWGTGTSLRYVQLGNEMVGTTCGAALGWLILRLSELADRCEPSLVRVFPGLASPSNRPDHPTDPVVDVMYLRRTEDDLNEVFYHVVRAALLVRVESGVAADATRFETAMPGIERAWTADPSTSLWGYINHQLYTVYTEADLPSTIFPIDIASLSDALLTTLKEWCAVNLQAPFQVMDFHWYNSRGGPGAFLYLHTLPLLLNRIRFVMGSWWDGGGVIPVWCTETGISSDRNPTHVAARRAAAEDGAGDFFTCYAHVPSCANHGPLGGGPEPPDPMGADAAAFEYRIDPALVQALADLGDPADAFPDPPEHWPEWVFTSEFEQAIQIWTRFAMLAGSGVEKTWWYANVVSETDQTELPTEFYSFG